MPSDSRKTPNRILFALQFPEMWGSFESVYKAMEEMGTFQASVWPIEVFDAQRGAAEGKIFSKEFLQEINVNIAENPEASIKNSEVDLLILNRPFLNEFPPELATLINDGACRFAYIPYGFEIGGGWTAQQFNTPVHTKAWRVFVRSERMKGYFSKYCSAGDSHVVASGHPKIDSILNAISEKNERNNVQFNVKDWHKIFLYTPHFSVRWWGDPDDSGNSKLNRHGWSTLEKSWDHFIQIAHQHQDCLFLFRPHPLLKTFTMNYQLYDQRLWDQFQRVIESMANVMEVSQPNYADIFSVTDALMTDLSSFLFEFLPTGKPILYLNNPLGPGLNEDGELIKNYYTTHNGEDMDAFVNMVISGNDYFKQDRAVDMQRFLTIRKEGNGRYIARYLDHHLNNI